MGVGKTVQALACCTVFKADWPVMVVCPASLKYNWYQEIAKWLGPKVANIITMDQVQVMRTSGDPIDRHAKFVIASYELALRIDDVITARNFKICI